MDSGFVLRTPRNDEGKFPARFLGKRFKFQTFIPSHSAAISPHDAREFAANVPPSEDQRAQGYPKRGAGNAGRPMRPQPRV
jgi:hypothetical protein